MTDAAWRSGAAFSPCRRWRWALWRRWAPELPALAFLGLNPSTADELQDDPTIRRCLGYARAWGCGSLFMLNLYGWRSTDPGPVKVMAQPQPEPEDGAEDGAELPERVNPIGEDNDAQILWWGGQAGRVIAAWGAFPWAQERGRQVVGLLEAQGTRVEVLDWTAQGSPRHPLYARGDLIPRAWRSGP